MNCVQLIGRLTHDPESDRVADGTPVAIFPLAVDRPRREPAELVTVKTWDRTAEAVAKHHVRGRRVAVQGRLFQDRWTGPDGQRASRLIVWHTGSTSSTRRSRPVTAASRRPSRPAARQVRSPRRTRRGDRRAYPQPVEIGDVGRRRRYTVAAHSGLR